MPIRCIVLDDEELAITHLLDFIVKVPFLELAGSFTDPMAAHRFLETNSVGLIFLDIEMPNYDVDGIDFINLTGGKHGYIFTTAYPQYALASYEYNAIDFLHKPISFERFIKSVHKAKVLLHAPADDVAEESYTFVRIDGTFHRLDFDDVCWIESDRNYVSIYTERDRINLKMNLGELEAQLPRKLFMRIHKSYVVARRKIDLVEPQQLWVRRQEQTKLFTIGEAYRKTVLELITQASIRKK